ncbi:MAG: hypothetical protein JO287_24175 [Pseudonocardiales bacterium]|nr:hypothetical protein [Pseudonocardiales bacterium]
MTSTGLLSKQVGGHAVVLGASMAGLLTARVLTDTYRKVTVIDRDVLPVSGGAPARCPTRVAICMPCSRAGMKCWRNCADWARHSDGSPEKFSLIAVTAGRGRR